MKKSIIALTVGVATVALAAAMANQNRVTSKSAAPDWVQLRHTNPPEYARIRKELFDASQRRVQVLGALVRDLADLKRSITPEMRSVIANMPPWEPARVRIAELLKARGDDEWAMEVLSAYTHSQRNNFMPGGLRKRIAAVEGRSDRGKAGQGEALNQSANGFDQWKSGFLQRIATDRSSLRSSERMALIVQREIEIGLDFYPERKAEIERLRLQILGQLGAMP